ncbi:MULTISPECIES: fatty acid desaturase family protein [Micromonospora]|uniref:Acyl-CoA desaturase n=1 Tax=Micromonospora chalcea TaxID=1874 RepID=A0ABX9Y8P0_MICCH|nr:MULTISPECIES: acyl-CoA desaturase [Micromonospora]EWM66199.1 delta 6 fatty acid desaturase [Micromonospora sp. M42]MBQ1060890.1 acyl-CoA desaturase [Micromonospora sp. C41]MCK1805105.1 acyl-CoA desaturase [Micromonospora sp. R42106]MCK1829939.1 acyl-CoA desaturase [Micromonospora sp. R42003]MCK1842010.1 acyl-CoA desaturase [Micromonospora sp. R42004]
MSSSTACPPVTEFADTSPPHRKPAGGSDFAVLNRRVVRAGLLERRPTYYAVRMVTVASMLVAGWTALWLVGASWWTLAVAAFLGVAFSHAALVAHDLAHRQVFRTGKLSERAGRIAANIAVGMSYGWWMEKHTRHHNNPNHDDLDPDVASEVLIWASGSARGRRGLKGYVTRHQAGLFFPLLTLLSIGLRVSSVRALLAPGMKRRGLEAGLMGLHLAAYVAALLLVLTPWQALAFFAVHHAVFGVYLGMTFAPNHKGMPHPEGTEDYLRKQVLTSRNVTGGRLTDAALGGLNYQIEHHLFPAMPTPNLRRAQPMVEAYCREIGVAYEQASLVQSYRQALRHLHEVGAPLRDNR